MAEGRGADEADDKITAVINRLIEDKFQDFIHKFTDKNCEKFLVTQDEFTLQHTEIHTQYKRLFEGRIESTLKNFGMSSQDFLGELLKKSEADENVSVIIEMLLAIEDFQQFCKMMKQHAIEKE